MPEIKTERIKNFILSETIISYKDFFIDILSKFDMLKREIEANRDNEKNAFYNEIKPKIENDCRDVILHRLKDKYGYDLELIKEKNESDNRVDINIKYKVNYSYEIQVECKRDFHREIIDGVQDQLIKKYLFPEIDISYGIYLIFYFDASTDKETLIKEVNDFIHIDKRDYIKVICIDLRRE